MHQSLNQHLSGEAHPKINVHFKGDLWYTQTSPIETISNKRLEHIVKGDLGAFKLARRFNINKHRRDLALLELLIQYLTTR